jgi:hypothetical protein
MTRPNQAPVTSPVPSVSSKYDNFFHCFMQRTNSINTLVITLTFIVYLFILCLKVRLKAHTRYNGCRLMRSDNESTYITFIPMGILLLTYAGFELCEVFRNASLA